MPGLEVDGNDAVEVYEAAQEAIGRARRDGGPTLIECKTYRTVGHFEGDPGTGYRTKEEVAAWKQRCPLEALRKRLLESPTISQESLQRIEQELARGLDEAVQFAKHSPEPAAAALTEHLF
jgi:TPP-dependent pyruvate/acetoin dehydrogenase alpha subunit